MDTAMKFLLAATFLLLVKQSEHLILLPRMQAQDYSVEGDLNIGFLVSIHRQSPADALNACSDEFISNAYSFQLSEMMRFAVREINSRDDILPNVTLGFVVKDICAGDKTALARSLYFLEDSHPTCNGTAAWDDHPATKSHPPIPRKVVGIIGPGSDEQAALVASLMSVANIPVLGTYTSSDELSNKARYEYFLRLVPPDRAQVQVLMDVARYFGWTYIAVVYTEGSYSEFGYRTVERLAREYGICVGYSRRLVEGAGDQLLEEIVVGLEMNSKAKAVIVLGETLILRKFFKYMTVNNHTLARVWLGGENLGSLYRYPDVASSALGLLSPKLSRKSVSNGFTRFMETDVSPQTGNNPWVGRYWEKMFDCTWDPAGDGRKPHCGQYDDDLSGNGKVPSFESYAAMVQDGVQMYARALQTVVEDSCPQAFGNTSELDACVTGPALLRSMKRVSFEGQLGKIEFGADGEIVSMFTVTQLVRTKEPGRYNHKMIDVAVWSQTAANRGSLMFNLDLIEWNIADTNKARRNGNIWVPDSVCSDECEPKQMRKNLDNKCCWECRGCDINAVLVENATRCMTCPKLTWPGPDESATCRDIHLTYLRFEDAAGMVMVGMAGFGAFVCLLILPMVIWQKKTESTAACHKEMNVLTLLGGLLGSLIIPAFLFHPDKVNCGIRRIGFQFADTLLYAAMFVKCCNLYRMHSAGKEGDQLPPCITGKAQAVYAITVIGIQTLTLVTSNILIPMEIDKSMPDVFVPYVEIFCAEQFVKFIVPLSFNILILLVCCLLAYPTRNVLDNGTDPSYLFASVTLSLVSWGVALPLYFTTARLYIKETILGFCLLSNIYINVGFLLLATVYCLCCHRPPNSQSQCEVDSRRPSTTYAKTIRVHPTK